MDLVLKGSSTDELFILLVAMVTGAMILIAHMGGLWTTKRDGVPDVDDDIFLVYTMARFQRLLPAAALVQRDVPFYPPDNDCTSDIPVLMRPTVDLASTGFIPKPEQPLLLLKILSNLANCTQQQYQQTLIRWMERFPDFVIIGEWLASNSQSWDQYYQHLESRTVLDSLELLLALMAMCFHLNLLHGDGMWSMRKDGSQNSNPTLAWIEDSFIFCDWAGQVGDSDSDSNLIVFHGGCKATCDRTASGLMKRHSQCDGSDSDNSLSELYDEKEEQK